MLNRESSLLDQSDFLSFFLREELLLRSFLLAATGDECRTRRVCFQRARLGAGRTAGKRGGRGPDPETRAWPGLASALRASNAQPNSTFDVERSMFNVRNIQHRTPNVEHPTAVSSTGQGLPGPR